ncbi:MAG: 50S ribosomal protein L37ae [Candidatus Korarchaeum sp.]|jgi:large subunit ribosomal protein L37Ae|nr:50S ribosomal protein L37ae [Candidatus Korarchaeum sp.]
MARAPRSKLRTMRYGSKIRKRVESILQKSKSTYKCPYCGAQAVKRVRLGVWGCKKCGKVFTGGAWEPFTALARGAELARETT